MTRPSWDETWLNVAVVIARRSTCVRAQVGAVIVDPKNRVVATGYNGPPRNFMPSPFGDGTDDRPLAQPCDGLTQPDRPFCIRGRFGPTAETVQSYSDCPSIHAEQNALNFCGWRDREGGTLYVTSHICVTCAKNIANSFIARVVIGAVLDDDDRAYREPELSYDLLRDSGVEVVLR